MSASDNTLPELPKMSNVSYGARTNTWLPKTWATGGYVKDTKTSSVFDVDLTNEKLTTLSKILKGEIKEMPTKIEGRRFVQVFIVDPDENVPLDKAVLYKGEPHLTDYSDEELFFSINVMELLEAHNQLRPTLVKTTTTTKKEFLKPIRIKDLSMTVVVIAQF